MRYFRVLIVLLMMLGLSSLWPAALAQSASAQDQSKGISLWQPGDPGQRLFIDGVVTNPYGDPIAGAVLSIWQADGTGVYREDRYRATLTTNAEGRYGFGTVLPGQYSSAKHIHVIISHDNYQALETQMLFMGDDNLDQTTQRRRGIFLEDSTVDGETFLYGRFDVVLNPVEP